MAHPYELRSAGLDPLDVAAMAMAARELRAVRERGRSARDPWGAAHKGPHPQQAAFTEALLGHRYDTLIHFGGARSGKSVAACLGFLAWGYRYPGSRFLIGRYDHKRLNDSTMVSMGEALGWLFGRPWSHLEHVTPEVGRWRAGVQHLELVNGATFAFTHFKDAGPLGSTEYDGAWIEEAQEIPSEAREGAAGEELTQTPEVVTMVQSRLNRITQPPPGAECGPSLPKLVLTAMGWGHNWVWDMGMARPGARTLTLESTPYDNRANVPAEWFARMEALPASESRRYLSCSHDDFEGKVFSAFTEANVLPHATPILARWPIIRAFDPGVTGAGWVWLAVAEGVEQARRSGISFPPQVRDGCVIAFDEYAPVEVPLAQQIREVLRGDAGAIVGGTRGKALSPVYTAIDPSDARQHTELGIRNTADLLKREAYRLEGVPIAEEARYDYGGQERLPGFGPLRKAPNGEDAFILQAQQGFSEGRYLVREQCTQLIRQLRSDTYEENARGERRRRYAQRYHLVAAWKYGIMSAPELLVAQPPEVERPRQLTRSRTGY